MVKSISCVYLYKAIVAVCLFGHSRCKIVGSFNFQWQLENIAVGKPGQKINPSFILTPAAVCNVSSPTSDSAISSTYNANIFFDSVSLSNDRVFSGYSVDDKNQSLISSGWFLLYYPAGIMIVDRTIISPINEKRWVGQAHSLYFHPIHQKYCGDNITVLVPGEFSHVQVTTACFTPNSNHILFPAMFGTIDRTNNVCYTFLNFNNDQVCSLDSMPGQGLIIDLHNKDYVDIGLDASNLFLAIAQQRTGSIVSSAWNEQRDYETKDVLLMILTSAFLVAWSLFFSYSHGTVAPKSALHFEYSLHFRLFNILANAFFVFLILDSYFNEALYKRIHYVVDPELQNYVDVYLIFVVVGLILSAMINVLLANKLIMASKTILQRSAFESVLVFGFASLFLGRTDLCEELVVSTTAGLFWIFFQGLYFSRAQKSTFFMQIALFSVLAPFAFFVLIVPLVKLIPDVSEDSWITTLVFLAVPIVMAGGYSSPLLKTA